MNSVKSYSLILMGLCVFALMISSCNLIGNDDKSGKYGKDVYDGIYLQGIEDSWFVPCVNVDESWKPIFTDESFTPVWNALNDSESYKLYIRVRGIPSKKGDYKGFFAEYDREFEIFEVLEARESDSGKCH